MADTPNKSKDNTTDLADSQSTAKPRNLEDSEAWQQSIVLSKAVHEFCRTLPHEVLYEFYTPLHMAAANLPTAVAAAFGRSDNDATKSYDYGYARTELFRIKSMVMLASKLGYVPETKTLVAHINSVQEIVDKELSLADALRKKTAEKQ